MIDNQALARDRDAEILALSDLMERVLRRLAGLDTAALAAMRGEAMEDLANIGTRDLSPPDRARIEAAMERQLRMIAAAAPVFKPGAGR